MACAKPMDERMVELLEEMRKLTAKTVEQNERVVQKLENVEDKLEYLKDKINIAEMRQCQSNAQGTDAARSDDDDDDHHHHHRRDDDDDDDGGDGDDDDDDDADDDDDGDGDDDDDDDGARMTGLYFASGSALWSSSSKSSILEMIYKTGDLSSMAYEGIFSDKDERRGELSTALFYKTYVRGEVVMFDAFQESGQGAEELFALMPTFRRELLALAKEKDIELGEQKIKELSFGSYFKRIQEALDELPADLQHLHDVTLPLNKQFEPVFMDSSQNDQSVPNVDEHIPEKVKTFVEWCKGCEVCSENVNKQIEITECIVSWNWFISQTARKQAKMEKAEHDAKRAKYDKKAEAAKAAKQESLLEVHVKQKFPKLHEINEAYKLLDAKAEKEVDNSES